MSKQLLIYLKPTEMGKVEWLVHDDNHIIKEGPAQNTLEEIAQTITDHVVTVIIPGIDVFITHTTIPKTSQSRLLKVVPYAIEDKLAEDIENLHFAFNAPNKDEPLSVIVISKELMRSILHDLNVHNIKPDFIVPDILTIPLYEKCWTIAVKDNYAIVRTGETSGFCCDEENLTELVTSNTKLEKPEKIVIHGFSKNSYKPKEINGTPLEHIADKNLLISFLAKGYNSRRVINLLQGQFKHKHKIIKAKKAWAIAIILLAAWLTTIGIKTIGGYFYYQHKQQSLNLQITKIYKKVFPNASTVVSPKLRIGRELKKFQANQSDKGFLFLLSKLHSITNKSLNVKLQSIEYQNQQLSFILSTNNFQTLQKIKETLSKTNIKIKQKSASSKNNKVVAEFVISIQ